MSENRIALTQEILVAFVDAELPSAQSAAVEAALVHDPAAREIVRRLQVSAGIAKRVSQESLNDRVPTELVEHIRRKMSGRQGEGRRPSISGPLFALAAGIAALVVGAAAGYLARDLSAGYSAAEAPGSDALTSGYEATLQGSLESGAAPGQSFDYDSPGLGHGKITLGPGFTASFGSACREFSRDETRGNVHETSNGIACRSSDGVWNTMLVHKPS
jgi:anti-sigma factor RsiW